MADRCGSCGAPIGWRLTKKGRSIPLDATADGALEEFPSGNIVLVEGVVQIVAPGSGLYRSHFASCPQAKEHRKR